MAKILITGASSKIGQKISIELAKRGFDLALHYFSSEHTANEIKRKVDSFRVNSYLIKSNVRITDEVVENFKNLNKNFGEIDILINNVGIFPKKMKFEEIEEQDWDNIFDVNLKSAFIFSQLFAKQRITKGKIINIASIGGLEHWKGSLLYNVSKAALIHFTKSLALELAPRITVNCISPGLIQIDNEELSISKEKIPMVRYGSIDDIMKALIYFIENDYVTGQNLIIDGGYFLKKR